MSNTRGLFNKFLIQRVDNSHLPGGKHHGCQYFVLDLTHDVHAITALKAYAKACTDRPNLSEDLYRLIAKLEAGKKENKE